MLGGRCWISPMPAPPVSTLLFLLHLALGDTDQPGERRWHRVRTVYGSSGIMPKNRVNRVIKHGDSMEHEG